jgi:hypothetical protein
VDLHISYLLSGCVTIAVLHDDVHSAFALNFWFHMRKMMMMMYTVYALNFLFACLPACLFSNCRFSCLLSLCFIIMFYRVCPLMCIIVRAFDLLFHTITVRMMSTVTACTQLVVLHDDDDDNVLSTCRFPAC